MGQQGKHLNSIKVSHEKHTAGCATEIMAIPETVCISMSQHIGAPCKPLVKKGDQVKVGQLIGDTDAFVSAPIHSSVSGTVKEISTIRSVTGGDDQVVIIETDGNQDVYEEIKPPVINDMKDFLACRADAVALEETDQALTQCLGRNSEQSAVVLLGLGADQVQKIDAEYFIFIG